MFRSYRDTIRTPVKTSKEASKKYFCDLCDDGESNEGWDLELDVEIHRRKVHKSQLIQMIREPQNYMCSVCLRQQANHSSLIAHIKKLHLLTAPDGAYVKRELFVCDYCNNIFFNKLLLVAHIKYFHLLTVLEKKTALTPCPACDKNVCVRSIWFHFLYHGIIHTGTCPICLSTFKDYNEALEHIDSHPGYYNCSICHYQAKKESLYQNHLDKHKKTVNLEGKDDMNDVIKFFIPQPRPASWSRKFLNIFKGITLAPELQICVLCRAICETDEQMLQHIYGDHSPENKTEIKRHICSCGEEFFNNVLLKHHIFTMKGDHKVHDGTSAPYPKRRRIDAANEQNQNVTEDTQNTNNLALEAELLETLRSEYENQLLDDPLQCNDSNQSVTTEADDTEMKPDIVAITEKILSKRVYQKEGNKKKYGKVAKKRKDRRKQSFSKVDQDQHMVVVTYEVPIETDETILSQSNETEKDTSDPNPQDQMVYVTVDQNSEMYEDYSKEGMVENNENNEISNLNDSDEQVFYVRIDQDLELMDQTDSLEETDRDTDYRITESSHTDEQVLYVRIDQNSSIVGQSENSQTDDKSNGIESDKVKQVILNSTTSDTNKQIDLMEGMDFSNEDIVENTENQTVYQICDESGSTISKMPEMFEPSQQFESKDIGAQDNVVDIAAHSLEQSYGTENSQETVLYEVVQIAEDGVEDPGRIVADEAILYS